MSSSAHEDQELRKSTGMQDSNAMTIDFLRARLLSERSVSKTARQRADELARRVADLEEQLKFVSLQRKKAEKATTDVLEILEKRGISDLSEGVDSCSDQDETPHELARNGSLLTEDTSTGMKMAKTDMEAYSSSELDYSPSTGRSLSWKSTKDSQYSRENKKCMDPVSRRANFASNCSSARRVGKSCRRVRRRDTRSSEKLQNDVPENVGSSRDVSNCSDGEHYELGENAGYNNERNPLLGSNSESKSINGQYFGGHERHEDMESALRHQAQLIGKYEAEEKAQREWEEKYRENNSGTQDSCDPGNHSDVTEEQYEIKSPKLLSAAGKLISNNQETRQEPFDARLGEGSQTLENPSLPNVDKGNLQDEKRNGPIASESSATRFSFQMSKDNGSGLEFSRKHLELSLRKCQQCAPMRGTGMHPPAYRSSHHVGRSVPQFVSPRSPSSVELAVFPQETSCNLGSVLEALQRAKLSLNQKLNDSSMVAKGISGNSVQTSYPETNMDAFKVPVCPPGLFRLPTDDQFKDANHLKSSSANFHSEIAGRRYLLEPLLEFRNGSFGDLETTRANHCVRPSNANFSYEPHSKGNGSAYAYPVDVFLSIPPGSSGTWPGVPPLRSLSQPRLTAAGQPSFDRMNQLEPYTNHALPLNPNEGTSRTFPSSETHLSYDLFRKNMQR